MYIDKLPKESEGYHYPIKGEEKVTLNLGYFVDKACMDDLYMVFNLDDNSGFASAYQYVIKIK